MKPDPRARITLPSLGRTPAAEMDLEIEAHRQLCIDDLVRSGMPLAEARDEADRRVRRLHETRSVLHHAARRRDAALRHRDWFGALRADIRFAFRQIRRNGAHSALMLVMLAIGIGMSTAMFTLVEHVLLKPLPFPHPEHLVQVEGSDSLRHPVEVLSNDDWLDWRRQAHVFAAFAASGLPSRTTLLVGDSATRVTLAPVSGDYFRVLQGRFVAGRPFTAEEVAAGTAGWVVSERFWRRYLGADPALKATLGTAHHPVIGVLASTASFPADVDVWQPATFPSWGGGATRSNIGLIAIARLRDGVSPAEATADLNRVAHIIRTTDPGGLYDYGASVRPLQAMIVAPDTASNLRLLMECVAVVLLIVCANLAATTLGRGAAREQEFAIRASLGAGRSRLVAQLLVEHVILAVAGGVGGVLVAWIGVRTLLHGWAAWIPRADEVRLDLPVLGFALAVSVLVGILAGIVPALRASRGALHASMKEHGHGTMGGRQRAASVLVVAEFALAVSLVTGAGLLLRSFSQLMGRDLGFDPHLASIEVALTGGTYSQDSTLRLATWDRLMDAYRAVPSVQAVGVANWVPLGTAGMTFLDIQGRNQPNPGAGYRVVSEDYFKALGVRVLAGRTFTRNDAASAERVVVINASLARRYWGSDNPLGQHIRARGMESGSHGEPAPWLTVIGVVSDLRQHGLEHDYAPEMYTSFRQAPQWRTTVLTAVVRASSPPERLLGPLRAATANVDPHLAGDATTMESQLSSLLAPRRITMVLLSGFSGLALLLAALGAYAVLSYAVTRRSRELALRAALGARRPALLRLVMASGMRVSALGILIGVAVSLAGTRLLSAMLVDISALDPATFLAAPALLLAAALAATVLPALRATRVDPAGVIRDS